MKSKLKTIIIQLLMATMLVGCSKPFEHMVSRIDHVYVQKLKIGMTKQTVLEINGKPSLKKTSINANDDCIEEWYYRETGVASFLKREKEAEVLGYIATINTTILIFENEKLNKFNEFEVVHPPTEDIDTLVGIVFNKCPPSTDE